MSLLESHDALRRAVEAHEVATVLLGYSESLLSDAEQAYLRALTQCEETRIAVEMAEASLREAEREAS